MSKKMIYFMNLLKRVRLIIIRTIRWKYLSVNEFKHYEHLGLSHILMYKVLKNCDFNSVLDIGSGTGKHANEFEKNGKSVTRFDFGKSRAFTPSSSVVIGDFVTHKFETKFDLVWASHVLEHTPHTHEFLLQIMNVVKDGGFVAITVPPAKPQLVGGHVTLWTPALLIYRLVLAGFDCSDAEIYIYGYNISVLVRAKRTDIKLDELGWDLNDVTKLQKWFPPRMKNSIDGARFGTVYWDSKIYFR